MIRGVAQPRRRLACIVHSDATELSCRANAHDVSISDLALLTELTDLLSGDAWRASIVISTVVAMVRTNVSIHIIHCTARTQTDSETVEVPLISRINPVWRHITGVIV